MPSDEIPKETLNGAEGVRNPVPKVLTGVTARDVEVLMTALHYVTSPIQIDYEAVCRELGLKTEAVAQKCVRESLKRFQAAFADPEIGDEEKGSPGVTDAQVCKAGQTGRDDDVVEGTTDAKARNPANRDDGERYDGATVINNISAYLGAELDLRLMFDNLSTGKPTTSENSSSSRAVVLHGLKSATVKRSFESGNNASFKAPAKRDRLSGSKLDIELQAKSAALAKRIKAVGEAKAGVAKEKALIRAEKVRAVKMRKAQLVKEKEETTRAKAAARAQNKVALGKKKDATAKEKNKRPAVAKNTGPSNDLAVPENANRVIAALKTEQLRRVTEYVSSCGNVSNPVDENDDNSSIQIGSDAATTGRDSASGLSYGESAADPQEVRTPPTDTSYHLDFDFTIVDDTEEIDFEIEGSYSYDGAENETNPELDNWSMYSYNNAREWAEAMSRTPW